MKPLFSTGPSIDKHIEGIITVMLGKLKNNSPDKDDKCYLNTVSAINDIYTGMFLKNRRFDGSRDNQFNMEGAFEKIASCKGDWTATRNLIVSSLANLEESKKPEKMPWNKKYVNGITFARFFSSGYTENGEIDCPFLHFVNPPKDSYAFTTDITIGKLCSNTSGLIRDSAKKVCKKYFKMKNHQLSFWYAMEDWTRWLDIFRKNFSSIYGEFLLSCKGGNPFADFTDYLMETLKRKEGEHPVVNYWYFRLTRPEGTELDGYFKSWLKSGIDSGRFTILRNLPDSVNHYYTNESFENNKPVAQNEKKVVEYDELEELNILF